MVMTNFTAGDMPNGKKAPSVASAPQRVVPEKVAPRVFEPVVEEVVVETPADEVAEEA